MVLEMDVENEGNMDSVITLQDFPLICRICCLKRSDLRLFEEEDYLFDLFHSIRKIEVNTGVEFPRNICNECVIKLEDLSLFIDISKYNDASFVGNMATKEEMNGYTADIGGGLAQKPMETDEKCDEDMSLRKSQTCRICLSSASTLIPFEERIHLMQVFRNITDIDVNAESNSSKTNSICNKCNKELKKISLFISLSICNDQKLETAIGRYENVETENDSDSIDAELEFRHRSLPKERPFEMLGHSSTTLQKPFKCDCCGRNFTRKDHLQRHRLIHTGEKPFKCGCCEESFNRKEHLKRHSLIHSGKKPFQCKFCVKSFIHISGLKRHMRIHSGEKPFECNYCEKTFRRSAGLKQHIRTHHWLV